MIKFEEHEGKLFRMLDKPVPLTPDAEMPCLVRLIQDDSPMGKHNKDLHGFYPERLTPRICTEVIVNDLSDPNRGSIRCDGFISCQYYRYELIGYPVAEGSAEWALYQMMQGETVTFLCYPNRTLKLVNGYIQDSISDGFWNRKSGNEFLSYASSTGWQLYKEPKPEPIFTTGDKVTDGVIDGTIIHIEDAIADVCPSTDEYKIELRNLNHISESPKQDDVEKPLRSMIAEAKAIGKNIRTYCQDIVFTPQALEACLNQGKFRWWNICNWELTTREQNYFPSISTSSDRPKPEPEPQYKVGDWVEWRGDQYMVKSAPPQSGDRYDIRSPYDELGWSVCPENITRKLSPADIVIRIGCLSGTIAKSSDPNYFLMLHSRPLTDCNYSMIRFTAIDTETRELVEGLLKVQEEE